MIGFRSIIRINLPAANSASWRLWGGIGLLLRITLGLYGFLLLQDAAWGVVWLAAFPALAWVGYQAEPVLEQKPPAPPVGPRRVRDGPLWMIDLPGGEFMMGASEGARMLEIMNHHGTASASVVSASGRRGHGWALW